jgi:hypothetical protein
MCEGRFARSSSPCFKLLAAHASPSIQHSHMPGRTFHIFLDSLAFHVTVDATLNAVPPFWASKYARSISPCSGTMSTTTTSLADSPPLVGKRVVIRIALKSIPGDVLARPFTLGRIYCENELNRPFDAVGDSHQFDDLHIPPGFDSEEDVKRWFIYDFGVEGRVDPSEYTRIPHECYRGCQLEDGSLCVAHKAEAIATDESRKFVPYPHTQEALIKQTKSYRWAMTNFQESDFLRQSDMLIHEVSPSISTSSSAFCPCRRLLVHGSVSHLQM